jgi:hypothetical protein
VVDFTAGLVLLKSVVFLLRQAKQRDGTKLKVAWCQASGNALSRDKKAEGMESLDALTPLSLLALEQRTPYYQLFFRYFEPYSMHMRYFCDLKCRFASMSLEQRYC